MRARENREVRNVRRPYVIMVEFVKGRRAEREIC